MIGRIDVQPELSMLGLESEQHSRRRDVGEVADETRGCYRRRNGGAIIIDKGQCQIRLMKEGSRRTVA